MIYLRPNSYPKSRQSHDATIDKLESTKETVPIKPSLKTLIVRGIIIVAYLLMGGLVFRALEYKKNEDKLYWTRKLEKEMETLFTYHNITAVYMEELRELIEKANYEAHHTHKEWDFYQSLYFASTITTTIGYGHITPKSQSGRMFLIIFAIFGIPLNILALASVGEHITVAIFHFLRFCSRKFFNNTKVEHVNIKVMLVSVALMFFLLLMGGVLYCSTEEWTYIDSIYYCFVAMATIGLGDLVPNHGRAPDTQEEKGIWFLRALYLSIGLSLVSTVFTALSNAMEEINLILGRGKYYNTWQPYPPAPGSKNQFPPKNKSASLESEKISYKHKIRKHGNTIMKYKLLKHLKRKRKERPHQNGWDGLFDEAKRKCNSAQNRHAPLSRSYQSIHGDGSTRHPFLSPNRTLIKSYSLDTYPKNSLLLIPVVSDNDSSSTKLSTMSEANSPSLFHKKMNQTLLLPYTDSRRESPDEQLSPTSSYGGGRNIKHKHVYRNHSEPIRRKSSVSSYINETSGLLLKTSPKMLRVPTPQQTKYLHKAASPGPYKNDISKFNWTQNMMSDIDYDIAMNQC